MLLAGLAMTFVPGKGANPGDVVTRQEATDLEPGYYKIEPGNGAESADRLFTKKDFDSAALSMRKGEIVHIIEKDGESDNAFYKVQKYNGKSGYLFFHDMFIDALTTGPSQYRVIHSRAREYELQKTHGSRQPANPEPSQFKRILQPADCSNQYYRVDAAEGIFIRDYRSNKNRPLEVGEAIHIGADAVQGADFPISTWYSGGRDQCKTAVADYRITEAMLGNLKKISEEDARRCLEVQQEAAPGERTHARGKVGGETSDDKSWAWLNPMNWDPWAQGLGALAAAGTIWNCLPQNVDTVSDADVWATGTTTCRSDGKTKTCRFTGKKTIESGGLGNAALCAAGAAALGGACYAYKKFRSPTSCADVSAACKTRKTKGSSSSKATETTEKSNSFVYVAVAAAIILFVCLYCACSGSAEAIDEHDIENPCPGE